MLLTESETHFSNYTMHTTDSNEVVLLLFYVNNKRKGQWTLFRFLREKKWVGRDLLVQNMIYNVFNCLSV